MAPKRVKHMEREEVAKCARNTAMSMAMELTDFINDADPLMECNLLFKIGMDKWWRSWLRHCTTSRNVAGSISDGVIGIFH
jgi:hypothetical protein